MEQDNRPTLEQWKKENPNKGLNEYYERYGSIIRNESSTITTPDTQLSEQNKHSGTKIFWGVGLIVLLLLSGFYLIDKSKFDVVKSILIPHYKDTKEIEETVKRVYALLTGGHYDFTTEQNKEVKGIPFYNKNFESLVSLGLMSFVSFTGDFFLEPTNIMVKDYRGSEATLTYDLICNVKGEERIYPVSMTVKKIGSEWKLDCEKIAPFNEKSLNE
jgi:hypothetical protein